MSPHSIPWDPGFGITYLKQLLKQQVLVHLKEQCKTVLFKHCYNLN